MATTEKPVEAHDDDDSRRLAELGYKQDLQRGWSSFSNFAISFTIISVLAGCFTTYGQAWNNGGPIAISWGWPIICGLILLVASMTEVQAAMTDLIHYIAHPREVLAWSNAQHARLVTCLERRDPATAMAVMVEHLHGTEHVLAGLLPAP